MFRKCIALCLLAILVSKCYLLDDQSAWRESRRAPFKRTAPPNSKPKINQNEDRNISIADFNSNVVSVQVDQSYPCLIPNVSREDGQHQGYRNYRIVVTSTSTYFPIFMNWLYQYYHLCSNTQFLYFVCFDGNVEKMLKKYNLRCNYTHYLPAIGSHQRLWLIRGLVVRNLIAMGYDVFLADSDAIWLRNPFPILAQFPHSDIIASRASYPEEIYERLGATICMGFVYFQSNPGTISLWMSVNDEMMRTKQPDDQRIFNRALMKLGLTFPRKLNYVTNKVHDTGMTQSKTNSLNVTMLSHSMFRRVCDITNRNATRASVVAHCSISAKDLSMKQLAAKNFGLWVLRPDWQTISVANLTMSEMLEAVAQPPT